MKEEAERCLSCDIYCSVCTTVCPNRANIAFPMAPVDLPLQTIYSKNNEITVEGDDFLRIQQPLQILNIVDFCNECGNCTSFCPTDGSPYITKPRFCLTEQAFVLEENVYFFQNGILKYKDSEGTSTIRFNQHHLIFEDKQVTAEFDATTFECINAEFIKDDKKSHDLKQAAIMAMYLIKLKGFYLFQST